MKDPSKLKLFKIWMISWRHNCKMFYFNHIIKLKRSIDLVSKLRQTETTIDEHCFHNHFLYGYRLFFSKLFWLVDLFSCSNSSWLSHLKFIEIKQVFSNKMFPFYPPPLPRLSRDSHLIGVPGTVKMLSRLSFIRISISFRFCALSLFL